MQDMKGMDDYVQKMAKEDCMLMKCTSGHVSEL
jgi:hypothetical protein